MGDLDLDTRLTGGDGTYEAALSQDWEIWGPNGGYLGAILLRAAGTHTDLTVPASIFVTFLARAAFAPVRLRTRTLRRTRRAECIGVTMDQGGRPIAEATAWFVADGLDGLHHDRTPMPVVARPEELPTLAERMASRMDGAAPHPFFANIDERIANWAEELIPGEPLDAVSEAWWRFVPTDRFDDPVVDAGRLVIALDTMGWPAAARHHGTADPEAPLPWVAPSLDLHVRFHRPSGASPQLLVRTEAPVGAGGLLTVEGRVWSEQGEVLASMTSQLLCTPVG